MKATRRPRAFFSRDRAGATTLEYALMAGLTTAMVFGALSGVGANLAQALASAGSSVADAGSAAGPAGQGFTVATQ